MDGLVTIYWRKPVPSPNYDWEAYIDGREECEVGRGATEAAAIADLDQQLEEA